MFIGLDYCCLACNVKREVQGEKKPFPQCVGAQLSVWDMCLMLEFSAQQLMATVFLCGNMDMWPICFQRKKSVVIKEFRKMSPKVVHR